MKNKASALLKQIMNTLSTVIKSKTTALRNKTRAFKARLVIFSLLHNRKFLMSSISHKLSAIINHHDELKGTERESEEETIEHNDEGKSMECREAIPSKAYIEHEIEEDGDVDKYPDLTHTLFDAEDMEFQDHGGSVIDMVKNSKENNGEDFSLEDEIDRVADLFIKRFHRQMWRQKQLSFERYQDMLQDSD